MPVIRPKGHPGHAENVKGMLAGHLYKELLGEGTGRGPVVFEIPASRPHEIDVVVVWESWRGIPANERDAIIRSSYDRYRQTLEDSISFIDETEKLTKAVVPRVMNVIGATWEEVDADELLPYFVRSKGDPGLLGADWVKRLMVEGGAIGPPDRPSFRFPTFEMAQEACDRMRSEMPEGRWGVVERMPAIDDDLSDPGSG